MHEQVSKKKERMIKIIESLLSNLQDEIIIPPTTTNQQNDDDDESIPPAAIGNNENKVKSLSSIYCMPLYQFGQQEIYPCCYKSDDGMNQSTLLETPGIFFLFFSSLLRARARMHTKKIRKVCCILFVCLFVFFYFLIFFIDS